MRTTDNTYCIFSDESGYDGANQYGSLAKVSGKHADMVALHYSLNAILDKHSKKEIKFKEVKSNRNKEIVLEFIEMSFKFLCENKIKVHVLVWDKHDSRHDIPNRCDIENLKRMYYHNMKRLLRNWNIEANWRFYPDEFSAINWDDDVVKFIKNTRINKEDNSLQQQLFEVFRNVEFPKIKETKELDSKMFPLIQLADIYAGLVRTSRTESEKYNLWIRKEESKQQKTLFTEDVDVQVSKNLLPKFETMKEFHFMAKHYRLGINFSDSKYFKTFSDKNNICIWHYEPQSEMDKAPVKVKNGKSIFGKRKI